MKLHRALLLLFLPASTFATPQDYEPESELVRRFALVSPESAPAGSSLVAGGGQPGAGSEAGAVPVVPLPPSKVTRASLEDEESPWRKLELQIGGLALVADSNVRFGASGAGISVDFEEALGLDSSTGSFSLKGAWRFTENRKHRLDLSWTRLYRSGSKTLGEDLDIGDETIPAGTSVKSSLDIDLLRAGYSYSFIQDERIDFAGSAGLYVAPISAEVDASVIGIKENIDITAPLPVIGLRLDVAMTSNVYFRSSVDFFFLKFEQYTGSLQQLSAAVEWAPWRHVGFGVGFDSFDAAVEKQDSTDVPGLDFRGNIDFKYTALVLYVRGYL